MSCNSDYQYETIIFKNEWKKSAENVEDVVHADLEYEDYNQCPTFFTNYHYCQICNKTRSDNFIILNCNHTFHINCLANFHHGYVHVAYHPDQTDVHDMINCAYCHHPIDDLELKYLHNKFYNNVNRNIININQTLKKLQNKIKKIQQSIIETEHHREELLVEQERSKAILNSMN
jgi:hypothetical protein